jgi:hypothetical protein
MKVFIVGIAGKTGSRVARLLAEKGDTVSGNTWIALADFGEFLGWFADRTILLMENHPLLGSVPLVSCLLLNFRGQASRCVQQTTPTGGRLGLFAASH